MKFFPHISRRDFLRTGTAATAAGILTGTSETRAAQTAGSEPVSSIQPGVSKNRVIGCYCTLEEILDSPKYIDALQAKLGVNTLYCSPPIRLPDWLLRMNPIGPDRIMNARGHTGDDSGVHRAVEDTHSRGMQFYLYYTGHHYGEESRPIISETFDGVKFLDLPPIKYSLESMKTSCFAKPAVREYEPAVFSYGARTYGADSMYVSHYRYASPSFWTNLFGCACSSCREEADRMGYDFEAMKNSMMKLRRSLERLDRKTLEQAARFRMTFTDFLVLLGGDNGVIDWLVFRSKVVGSELRRIHDAVHTATAGQCRFMTDTFNATQALFVGHNWADFFDGASDALQPLSWCATQHISAVASWANQLCEWVPGLEESTALKLVTTFFGYDGLGLPDKKIADLRIGEDMSKHDTYSNEKGSFYGYFNPDLTIRLMTHEWTRMTAINRGRLPAHPVIKGFEWPEPVCRELMARALDLGLNGYVFQRTDVLIDKSRL
ncbi:twin-arginine translocation signal domain-containing protein [bacterium]|nr:twin-arginine translocation signal domain-containing protein [bacterium]